MDNSLLLGEAVKHPDLIVLLVMGSSLIVPALYNSLASIQGFFGRQCYRDTLKENIESSRLGKMLNRRGIDLQYYLFNQPATEIDSQVRNCKCCDSFDQCDSFLENKKIDNDTVLPFCRNSGILLEIRNQQGKLYGVTNTTL